MLKNCYKYRELILNFVSKELKLRYRGSFLGFFWTLIDPSFMIVVLLLVFTKLFRYDLPNYPTYLLIGIFVWNYFQEATIRSTHIFLEYANIITKTNLPKEILILAVNIFKVIDFLLKFFILIIILFVLKFILDWSSLIVLNMGFFILPLIIFLQFILVMSLSFILGSIHIYYRDMAHIWGILMHVGFFITPVFYPAALIPEKYNFILALNPLYHLIEMYRQIILNNYNFINIHIAMASGFVTILLISSYILFKKLEPKFVENI